jgi:hypothetical protein
LNPSTRRTSGYKKKHHVLDVVPMQMLKPGCAAEETITGGVGGIGTRCWTNPKATLIAGQTAASASSREMHCT